MYGTFLLFLKQILNFTKNYIACAFALEPVARLAAYWNRPIITGMGDQVLFFLEHIHK